MVGGTRSTKTLAGTTKAKKRGAKPVLTSPRKVARVQKETTPETPTVDIDKVDIEKDAEESDDEVYVIRPIVPEFTLDKDFLEGHLLGKLNELLKFQGWEKLFQERVVVDEDAVRDFYANLMVIDRPGLIMANFVVGDNTFIVTDKLLGEIIGVSTEGRYDYVKGEWPTDVPKSEVILSVGEDETNSSRPGTSLTMGVFNRTLHRLYCGSIVPRMQKHTLVSYEDYIVMHFILNKQLVSLPKLVLLHMQHCIKKKSHGFPYPGFVKKILQHFKVYEGVNEVVMSSSLNLEAFESIGWRFDAVEGWHKKRREVPADSDDSLEDVKPDISLLSVDQGEGPKIVSRLDEVEKKLVSVESKVDKLISLVEKMNEKAENEVLAAVQLHMCMVGKLPDMMTRVEDSVLALRGQVGELQEKLAKVTGVVVKDAVPLSETKNPVPHA